MTLKSPTDSTLENWHQAIEKKGYKRIKLRVLLRQFGVSRRGSAVIKRINEFLSPQVIERDRAESLDDSVRITGSMTEFKQQRTQSNANANQKDPSNEIVRAISIRQPYVEAILDGLKTVEYRSLRTKIRERVYLYASQSFAEDAFEDYDYDRDTCPRGKIVGSVEIVDCTGEPGDYEYHLKNPVRLEKFPKHKNRPQPVFWRPKF